MIKKSELLKFDFDSFVSITESIVNNDPECQEVIEKHRKLFDKLIKDYSKEIAMDVDNLFWSIETAVREAVYKAAFQSGMNFILNALAGKEVIEI